MKKSTVILSGLAGFAVFAVAKKISSWVKDAKEFQEEMIEVQVKMTQEEAEEKLTIDKQVFDLLTKVARLEEENRTLKCHSSKEEKEALFQEFDVSITPDLIKELKLKEALSDPNNDGENFRL